MIRVERMGRKRHIYKRVQSPVGSLTLVASDEGLAAILWENDRPRRVPLHLEAEDNAHPVLVEAERQLQEYFAGRRQSFALKLDPSGTAFDHSVRRNAFLCSDCEADRASRCRARRRGSERQKSFVDRGALPSRRRFHGRAHGIRRRPRRQGAVARARRSSDRLNASSADPQMRS
jgi:hypothetical protein